MSDANTHVDGRKALCKSVFSIIRFVLNERPKLLALHPRGPSLSRFAQGRWVWSSLSGPHTVKPRAHTAAGGLTATLGPLLDCSA